MAVVCGREMLMATTGVPPVRTFLKTKCTGMPKLTTNAPITFNTMVYGIDGKTVQGMVGERRLSVKAAYKDQTAV